MQTPTFTPLSPHVGARVEGLAINQPLSPATFAILQEALYQYGVLLFKNVEIDEDEQIRLARYFGRISKLGEFAKDQPDALYVSNARDDGILGNVELTFHSDKFYTYTPPKAAMLYGMEIPSKGGETNFTNTAHIVRTMDAGLRERLMNLKCRHKFSYKRYFGSANSPVSNKPLEAAERDQIEIADHPVIAKHPWSDQHYLTIHTQAPKSILGVSEEDSRALVAQLAAMIENPDNIYRHVWQKRDLIIWDNYLLQHARTPLDGTEARTLRRCQIANELEPVRS